ncbi:MAG: hypothetical protein HYZ32_01705 [Hydrocarboniphaga effusa]|nr:hypothetical protein [Hydrocarboniphaga effusa]
MRSSALVFACGFGLIAGTPVLASDGKNIFADGSQLQVAHEQQSGHDHEGDDQITREELDARKRELREQERELRERERVREARRPRPPRVWVGLGTGVAYASADVQCSSGFFGSDCTEQGDLRTYSANITFAGRHSALRVRGIRDQDKGNDARTAYEKAVLIGSRFGHSNWYGMVGYGRILHVDDDYPKDKAEGLAWEILFAPSSQGATGLELSFQGHSGKDVDFVGFTLGFRIGALR